MYLLLPRAKLNEGYFHPYFYLPVMDAYMDVADLFTSNLELHNMRRNKRRCTVWWWMSGGFPMASGGI